MAAAIDKVTNVRELATGYRNGAAITPSDAIDCPAITRAIYVGVSGDIVATMQGGGDVTFKAAPVGILPVRASRVKATLTTATNLIALW